MKFSGILLKGGALVMIAAIAASCSNEEVVSPVKGDGSVTFSASLANALQTRAFSDGLSAVNLKCAVYDEDGVLVTEEDAYFTDLKATVSLQLITDKVYDVVFFASHDPEVYAFDTATGMMTVDYSKMNKDAATAETLVDDDCFYFLYKGYRGGSSASENVTLTRPVAQVNFGTDDYDAKINTTAFPNGISSAVTFKAYNQMNLLTGEESGEEVEVTLPVVPCGEALRSESFPVKKTEADAVPYEYVSMGYALVASSGVLADIRLDVFDVADTNTPKVSLTIPNAPMKRNFRTNIYGHLLTASSDWDIIIDNEWGGEDFNLTDYNASTDLSKGGVVNVNAEVAEIAIPTELAAPLTLNLNAKVGSLKIGEISSNVTLNVAKDVDYPNIMFEAGSTVKGLSIVGDPTSTKYISGFNFMTDKTLSRPEMLEDLAFEGVVFNEYGFESQYSCSTRNTVFRNCQFLNIKKTAVNTQQVGANTNFTCENMAFIGCTFEFASDAASNANGLTLVDIAGEVLVSGNVFRNVKYHGLRVAQRAGGDAADVTVEGNTFVNIAKDGVKLEVVTGEVSINDNKIAARENGIRLKNSVNTSGVTISGNSIDMKDAIEWDGDSEPSAILLVNDVENAGAKVSIFGNVLENSNGHGLTVKRVKYADGSDVATPFQ